MRTKYIATLFLTALFSSCATRTISQDFTIPKAPIVVENISPTVTKVIETNKVLENKVNNQSKLIAEQKMDIDEAIKKAESIRKSASENIQVKEQDALDLVANLKTVHTRNLFLETENNDLSNTVSDQSKQLDFANSLAAKKDSEVAELRQQSDQKDNIIKTKNEDTRKIIIERDKAIIDAASANVYKHWIYGILGGFLLWTILKNVLMMYFPTTRFRI